MILLLNTEPRVSRKMLKSNKKDVDIMQVTWYYIQVDAIRQQNKSQSR